MEKDKEGPRVHCWSSAPSAASADQLQNRCCAVCACAGASIFCAVYCCRPCASFFRRSVKDRREYKCRARNGCPIDKDGMRNCCRACRLRLCFEAGMRPELVANGHTNVRGLSSAATNCHCPQRWQQMNSAIGGAKANVKANAIPSSSSLGSFAPSECLPPLPVSSRICQSLREFRERQKAICAQHFGVGVVLGHKLRAITHEEYVGVERGSVVLLLNFVRALFPQIDAMPTQQKTRTLKNFTFPFTVLHSCELTLNHPLMEGDGQLVILPGCVYEWERFASTITGPGKQQQMAFGRQYVDRFCHFIAHTYKPLAIEPMEFAAVLGIQLWKCVSECMDDTTTSHFGTADAAADRPIDALFIELHSLAATASQGGQNWKGVAVRFGRILSMLSDVSALGRDLNELFTLCKVFLDPESCVNSNDLWDEMFGDEKAEEKDRK